MNRESLHPADPGEPLGFEEAYRSYTDRVNRFFYFRTHSRETALDLSQQTFLQLFLAYKKGHIVSFSSSLIFTTARHVFSNYIRTLKRHPLLPLENIERVSNKEETILNEEAELGILWKDAKSFPQEEQYILQMRYVNNLPIRFIAKKLRKSENSIKLKLSRAREKLRKCALVLVTPFLWYGVTYL